MIRNLKILGLALVAVLATSAVAASGAQAQKGKITVEGGGNNTATLVGAQEGVHVFKANGNEVTCGTATFHAAAKHEDETVKASATYSNCHIIALFTFSAEVKMNGCEYHFSDFTTEDEQGNTDPTGNHTNFTGTTKLICPAGKAIEVKVPVAGCTLSIGGEQEFKDSITAKNVQGTKEHLTLNATVNGIAFTSTGGLCGASGNGGTYNGATTIEGEETGGGAKKDVTISHN